MGVLYSIDAINIFIIMCGIIGYTGSGEAMPILLGGLAALEYRGYDSAGVYVSGVGVVKSVGKVAVLAQKCSELPSSTSSLGIAHTRWATHGEPSEVNAHPHSDATGTIHIVHNGIIENYRELKAGLEAQGILFDSATDTEVLAKLIGHHYNGDLLEAVTKALSLVHGTYGLVVAGEAHPGLLVAARMGSPIVLGIADGSRYVASDPTALLPHTRTLIYLEDGDIATLTSDKHTIMAGGKNAYRPVSEADFNQDVAKKDGYAHFMEKEMFEAPEVIRNTIRGRIIASEGKVKLGGLESVLPQIKELNRLIIVGCGSAYYAGQVGRLMIEEYTGLPVEVELGSEYRYKRHVASSGTGVLAITQSGETADTLASIKTARERGLLTFGIVNVVGSSIARETVAGVYNHAGPEVAVASTKAFLSQLTVLALMTVLIGREKGVLGETEAIEILTQLEALPDIISEMLSNTSSVKAIAESFKDTPNMMYIGRKFHAPLAYEGSLKLKEVTYIHAEAYAAGELKHGSIALLGSDFPVFALAPMDDVYAKMISNIEEVKARRAPLIIMANTGDEAAYELTPHVIEVPKVHPLLQPIISTIPLQLFAYYVGVARGLDVDQPRNLAKSVTVE